MCSEVTVEVKFPRSELSRKSEVCVWAALARPRLNAPRRSALISPLQPSMCLSLRMEGRQQQYSTYVQGAWDIPRQWPGALTRFTLLILCVRACVQLPGVVDRGSGCGSLSESMTASGSLVRACVCPSSCVCGCNENARRGGVHGDDNTAKDGLQLVANGR